MRNRGRGLAAALTLSASAVWCAAAAAPAYIRYPDINGNRIALPTSRVHAGSDNAHVGVRPEKMQITISDDGAVPSGHNALDGVVIDASFIGVSTQYLVRLPWGQEIAVFSQNVRRDDRLVDGAKVSVHWDPAHAFALDAAQSADAGVDLDEEAALPDPVAT